ncbi:MAG: hypothetical protein WCC27_18830 [Acidobacteriaceae bacterium]
MTLYEWKYKQGWIWIADNANKSEHNRGDYAIYVDPTDIGGWFDGLTDAQKRGCSDYSNLVANTEAPSSWYAYEVVMRVWESLGSPRIDRKSPNYAAPVFPIADIEAWAREQDAAFERAAEAIEVDSDILVAIKHDPGGANGWLNLIGDAEDEEAYEKAAEAAEDGVVDEADQN